MLGVDIVSLKEIEKVYVKHGTAFLEKILVPAEIAELKRSGGRVFIRLLGYYFAAKEAIFKACGDAQLGWAEINISGINKIPNVQIKRPSFAHNISLTFSFSRDMVIAQALVTPSKV